MLSWLAKQLITYVMGQTSQGNIRPTLLLDAPDVRLTFPGDNSWSGVYEGKEQVEQWLRRFVLSGIQISPDEVVAKGFPWNMTVCIRGTDHLRSPEGDLVYENRYVIWGRLVRGRMKQYEVYEDTIAPRALDQYLERIGSPAAAPARPGSATQTLSAKGTTG